MVWATAAMIMGGAAIAGGAIAAQGAKSAAKTQLQGTREAIAQQQAMFDTQNEQQAPYREAGYSALSDIGAMKPYLTHQFGQEDFQAGIDPSYNWRLQQGNLATSNLINRSGGLIGGNALTGLTDYAQGAASTEYGKAFDRDQAQRTRIYNTLASIAGIGQTAQGQTSALAQNVSGNIGQATIGGANAVAGGQVGTANAYSGAIQGAGNAYYMANLLGPKSNIAAVPSVGANQTAYMPNGQVNYGSSSQNVPFNQFAE